MRIYSNGAQFLQDDEQGSLSSRVFRLAVFASTRATFVSSDSSLSAVLAQPGNASTADVALKTQIIADPSQRFNQVDKLLQFFIAASSRGKVPEGNRAGVIYCRTDSADVPVAFLDAAEVRAIDRGSGAAVDVGGISSVVGYGVRNIVVTSQAAYDALDPPDDSTLYLISE